MDAKVCLQQAVEDAVVSLQQDAELEESPAGRQSRKGQCLLRALLAVFSALFDVIWTLFNILPELFDVISALLDALVTSSDVIWTQFDILPALFDVISALLDVILASFDEMERVFHHKIRASKRIGTKIRIVPAMAPETTLIQGEDG